MSSIISVRDHQCVPKNFFFIQMQNKKKHVGECVSSWRTRMYIWNSFLTILQEKIQVHKFYKWFWFFTNFEDFQLKFWDLYRSFGTDIDGWFFPINRTFEALQVRIPFGRFGDTCIVLWGTLWNSPTGITKFFGITQEGADQPFSSSSLERDINKTVLCPKLHHNRINLWRVIV